MREEFTSILRSSVKDQKGRVVSYMVILGTDGSSGKFYADVHKTRDGYKYGPARSGKLFETQAEATAWAWETARKRMSDLQKKCAA